jgi:hypothetical protein
MMLMKAAKGDCVAACAFGLLDALTDLAFENLGPIWDLLSVPLINAPPLVSKIFSRGRRNGRFALYAEYYCVENPGS